MEQLSWIDILQHIKESPDIDENMPDCISMIGALNVPILKEIALSGKLYEITSDIEAKLKKSYPSLNFVGKENKNEVNGNKPSERYAGKIYGSDGSDVVVMMIMNGVEAKNMDSYLSFFAQFQLGGYQKQTKTALKEIDQHITGYNSYVSKDSQALAIRLKKNGKDVVLGEYAIKELGIQLNLNKALFTETGIPL